jgi:hypothetical protein
MKALHLDPVWLRQKYEEEGLSTYAIAALVSRNPTNIHDQLVKFEIPRRPKWSRIAADANASLVAPRRGWKHTEEARQKCIAAATTPHPSMRGAGNPMFGKRGALHPNFKGGNTPERQAIYASAEWAELSRQILARDNYLCHRCGDGNRRKSKATRGNLCLHHMKGWAEYPEGRLCADNIVVLCVACHRWVHSRANVGRLYLA